MIRCNHHNPLDYNHHDHHDYHHHKLDHHKLNPHLRSSLEDVTQELRRLRPRTLRNFCSLSFHVSIYSYYVCLFFFTLCSPSGIYNRKTLSKSWNMALVKLYAYMWWGFNCSVWRQLKVDTEAQRDSHKRNQTSRLRALTRQHMRRQALTSHEILQRLFSLKFVKPFQIHFSSLFLELLNEIQTW